MSQKLDHWLRARHAKEIREEQLALLARKVQHLADEAFALGDPTAGVLLVEVVTYLYQRRTGESPHE